MARRTAPGAADLARLVRPNSNHSPAIAMNITLYTLSTCPFCVRAQQLLDSKGLEYTNHVMDGKDAEPAAAKQEHGHPTVPIVLVDGKLIGGASELAAFDAQGGLG